MEATRSIVDMLPVSMVPSPVDELVAASAGLQAALDRVEGTTEQLRELKLRLAAIENAHADADEALTAAYARLDAAYAGLKRPARPTVAERRHERLENGEPADDVDELTGGWPESPAPLAIVEDRTEGQLREDDDLADDAPHVVTRPPAPVGLPGMTAAETRRVTLPTGMTARQAEILEVVQRLGSSKLAAKELRVAVQSIEVTLDAIGKRGRLPIELIPLLPARFAKYKPAGL